MFMSMPLPVKPEMKQFSTLSCAPIRNRMPLTLVPRPLIDMPRRITLSPAPALTLIPLSPATKTDPKVPEQSIVIALVMVRAPNPPRSKQLISPPAAVLEMAPAKVLHGAERLHGLASSPRPETQVRLACA